MLVLSRKVNQQIGIGNDIKVFVIAVHGDRVRLGFSAPEDLPIFREEVRRLSPPDDGTNDVNSPDQR